MGITPGPLNDDCTPVVEVDTIPICNEATGLLEYHQTVTTDGIPADPVIILTDDECDGTELPDIDVVVECRNGAYQTVVYATLASTGAVTEVSVTDSGEICPPGTPECVKWQSVFVQMDNTGTRFDEETVFTIENTDGSIDTFSVGPVAGWSDQVTAIAAAMDAAQNGTYDPRCTFLPNGCGGLLPPPSDAPAQPGIFARYINGVHCPTDIKIPVKATATRANGKVVDLPFYVIVGPEYRGQICRTCNDGAGELQYEDGTPVAEADLPVCTFTCAETIPEAPLAACQFDTLAGNWCDLVLSGDPETEDEIVQSEIVITISTCGSEQSISYGILDGDALEPYEPVGSVVDCETGEEPFVEPPPCPEGAVFECVEIPANGYGILDNSLWDDGAPAPGNHLQNGNAYEITLTAADGTTHVVGPLTDPYFNSFINLAPTVLDGCVVKPVCANHTSPKGCNPGHVANLAAYPAYDQPTAPGDPQNNLTNPALDELWATGWLIDCAGCSSPLVRAEITASTDPAWVGVAKDIITHLGVPEQFYRSINCDGVFWKDCDGNDVPAPTGGCCAQPCAPASVPDAIECALVPCEDPCVEGSTYIFGRPPAGEPWSWGPYSGENLVEFEAALTAAGYTVNQVGEKHQICPPFGAFGEDPDALVINAVGESQATVEPNIDPDFVAEDDGCAVRTIGKNDDRRDDLLEDIAGKGADCDTPIFTKECPPEPCPPPSIEVFCDPDGTKYVSVGYATDICGTSGTFVADDYYADPQILTAFEPTGTPQICEDATVKDQACLTDECGDRWTCVTTITPVGGTVVESETCVPYIEPDCGDAEGEEGGRVAAKTERKAVKSLTAVKSIKLTAVQVNTQITATADPEVPGPAALPVPVGETCPCPCPDPVQDAILDKLCQLVDILSTPCDEDNCPALDVGDAAATDGGNVLAFPLTACSPTVDFAVPISFAGDIECLTAADPATLIRVRWEFDHEPDPSESHTGFNVSVTGAAAGNLTPVALSSTGPADIGPSAVPHNGPRETNWADFDIPLADLLAGVALQTSAFGTINTECETIYSQTVTISPDDSNLSAICDC